MFSPLKLIKADTETTNDDDVNISPELTRELLVAAMKLLGKEKNSHLAPKKPIKVLKAAQQQPCSNIIYNEKNSDNTDTEEPQEKIQNGRRSIITTTTAIAKDPVTGLDHVITYPVIFPTYKRYSLYG
jgi:hypothetical protein